MYCTACTNYIEVRSLAPFLIFAIGLSHGAQKMNGIMQDVGRGTHKYVAARYTFRRLFM
jgi:predicted RND superfamily exporter protein